MKRVHVIVMGIVQGVGFRFFAQHLARQYELSGYARNRGDGTVEVEAEGPDEAIGAFLKELRVGPRSSDVTGMDVEERPAQGDFGEFRIKF
jgi:acylphosphatase